MEKNSILPDLSSPVVMTIVNVTPDSFYSDSRRRTAEEVRAAVLDAAHSGASILDVGGYSSRPGADDVSPDEEFARIATAMEIIRSELPGMAVSVDTFRASVVERTVADYGPVIVNDISAGELNPDMIPLAAKLTLPYIAMHMRATPATMQQHTDYDDIVSEVCSYFESKVEQLRSAGIEEIVLDPGFGFAKDTHQNYLLLKGLHRLAGQGLPVLSGVSRKSMIYKLLGTTPQEALAGTTALHWESLRQGAKILRVHDTREAADVVKIYNYFDNA